MARIGNKALQNTGFLADLVLWRNDPELAEEISQLAHEGNRDAQYALGLIYAEGRGFKQDEVTAYFWLSQAMAQGDKDAELLRQLVQQSMTLEEIHEADKRLLQPQLH
jgi:TPR repeat protein